MRQSNVVAMPEREAAPLTTVTTNKVTREQVEQKVIDTMTANASLLQRYHQLWYESVTHTWGFTTFLGVGMLKCPNDMFAYHDILLRTRPKTVIECGTFAGGSALWFAWLMDMLGIDGQVVTVDIDPTHRSPLVTHPRITFVTGSSVDPTLAESLISQVERPLLVVLDSDHSEHHVRKELELYASACQVGDRLTVEDTNVAWPNDRGARGALEDYLAAHPGQWRHDILCERWLLTMHPSGWLERVQEYRHEDVRP